MSNHTQKSTLLRIKEIWQPFIRILLSIIKSFVIWDSSQSFPLKPHNSYVEKITRWWRISGCICAIAIIQTQFIPLLQAIHQTSSYLLFSTRRSVHFIHVCAALLCSLLCCNPPGYLQRSLYNLQNQRILCMRNHLCIRNVYQRISRLDSFS